MSDDTPDAGAPDVELLADLDAGLLDPVRAGAVRDTARADPRSAAVLDALAATRADLAALRPPPLPPGLAQPWVAPPAPRARAPRRGLLAAAAAVVVALAGGAVSGVAGPGAPADVTRVELAAVARSTVGLTDLGPLADPARRAACLDAAGRPGAAVLGGRRVRLDGVDAVLLVLPTGQLGRIRVLVVTPSCTVLDDAVVG
ncbi:hypothetical protein [Pseudonocardia broussonetiae]|uniref:Anti-sigma-M factor RsmA n=1 Tax=Pseudonocardia broussonetiae TaxID=2736640 RepID=A0A6M6JG85_9PSEU|nr:hypothetical protein [Pseudonocardia broussonetiae]QJY45752.1 hypothetical protein HOP40_08025 [Pseudonocardia broussonetiae]